jgi:hypothetical protein
VANEQAVHDRQHGGERMFVAELAQLAEREAWFGNQRVTVELE